MDRGIPYESQTKCDFCSNIGAYDFFGDYFCSDCLKPKKSPNTNLMLMESEMDIENNVSFWIVIRDTERANLVCKRHFSEGEARVEAERLCKKENARFFLLHTVAYVDPNEPPVTWHESVTVPEVKTPILHHSQPIYNLHGDWAGRGYASPTEKAPLEKPVESQAQTK